MSEKFDKITIESDIDVPKWLTIGFIEKHLQIYNKNGQIKVSRCIVRSATAKGENFASQIFRLNVDFYVHIDAIEQVKLVQVESPNPFSESMDRSIRSFCSNCVQKNKYISANHSNLDNKGGPYRRCCIRSAIGAQCLRQRNRILC